MVNKLVGRLLIFLYLIVCGIVFLAGLSALGWLAHWANEDGCHYSVGEWECDDPG